MNRIKVGIIYGGMSTEHDVSVVSGKSVLSHINPDKYECFPIYIDKNGDWYKVEDNNPANKIEDIISYLKSFDVIFPVLHGKYGEDGTIQGMIELLNIPIVGCGVLASAVAMDKVYTKIVLDKANINQAKCVYVKKLSNGYAYYDDEFGEKKEDLRNICDIIASKLQFPLFIKPSNSGSSVGVNKANNKDELNRYIEEASKFDVKILVEQGINGREVECSVLGNEEISASCVGEIKPAEDFYTYDAKYNNSQSELIIPANLSKEISDEIRLTAIKAFKAIDGSGLARIDFFVENGTNKVFLNEINTMPGFTSISMYPKLWEQDGLKYEDLIDQLIMLAMNRK